MSEMDYNAAVQLAKDILKDPPLDSILSFVMFREVVEPIIEQTEKLEAIAREASWWIDHANEPDDEAQTKEQFRLRLLNDLDEVLEEMGK